MEIDITKFHIYNVIDTCAIWDILSSKLFYSVSINHLKQFAITNFVLYEALHKPRKSKNIQEEEIQKILINKINIKKFNIYEISIEDLQDPYALKYRNHIGKGELSCILFTKKTSLAFLTDDQKARKNSEEI